ncbi:glycoside hydrolase family 2 protein [Labilibacter marinus]|uniref:glycoside hydrolase family 2 protein n=1 Tax=Labilibacter marinus TaxID=1477105 RepID=UPI0008313452|nr:glycoside hydrolase family 2 [Labilibacter marinus]
MKKIYLSLLLCLYLPFVFAQTTDFEYSKAGFFELENSGREVYDFNSGWRFIKGNEIGAERFDFIDKDWEIVNCPHGLELNSDQASGSANYLGVAWYRKHFTIPFNTNNRRVTLHFEAVMGKCKVWLNGHLLQSHYGGYLPFEVDLTKHLRKGENVLSVWADNSNDPLFPPGKAQERLDFSYFGGIYRDVWLVSTAQTYITNPNTVDELAGGGVFVHYENLTKQSVHVVVKTHINNIDKNPRNITVQHTLKDSNGNIVVQEDEKLSVNSNSSKHISKVLKLNKPQLWTPDSPTLYTLETSISHGKKTSIDGVSLKLGIRKIEFKGKDGFWLNNEPFEGKLTGVNRHQDHAYVGNALPNNGSLRDAWILKKAGCMIIRAAHYPADPAFMDACDALGMFFIVATPGWHHWHKDPIFEQRVISDIRNMVRRDRNHASVIWWEPILNETWYPASFAKNACDAVHQEYPYQGAYTASDHHAEGGEHSDLTYSHQFKHGFWNQALRPTSDNYKAVALDYSTDDRTFFVREWGDAVDNWSAHNSPSRAARSWGEKSQLVQAQHYEQMDMVNTDWETLYKMNKQHIGGTLWCGFDHQRGYHPDPFYGGLTDVFRQTKYSYQLFRSQKNPKIYEPMVYMAHEMTPFSDADIKVFTNCDEVRLIRYEKDTFHIKISDLNRAMPHPSVVFKDVYRFMDVKALHGNKELKHTANIKVEGLMNGKVVAIDKKETAQVASQIRLERLTPEVPFEANGSDFITVIASITDKDGNIKRQNNSHIRFEVEGEGEIIDDGKIFANPRLVEWGTAPILIRSTNTAGKITIIAHTAELGINKASFGSLTVESSPAKTPALYSEERNYRALFKETKSTVKSDDAELIEKIRELEKELHQIKLKEVEQQQTDFIGGKKKE